jgi:hypothetical protein
VEPTKEQLEEWWRTAERIWQIPLQLRGGRIISSQTGYCKRGGQGGPFCLHNEDHGSGLFGEEVIATSWGGYMHVECAARTLREREELGWRYTGFMPAIPITTVQVQSDEPVDSDPVSIENDDDTPSGMRIEGAGLEEVLQHGTQAEIIQLLAQFSGQPIIVTARETDRSRMGRPIYRYFAWKVVE